VRQAVNDRTRARQSVPAALHSRSILRPLIALLTNHTAGPARLLLAVALAALAALGLLGGELPATTAHAQGTAPTSSTAITLDMGDFFFNPKELSVPTGSVHVVIKNGGSRKHNFTIEDLGIHTPDIDPGSTFDASFTFTQPGTYQFICDLPTHAQRGMIGTITVTAAPAVQATAALGAAPGTGSAGQPGQASQGGQPGTGSSTAGSTSRAAGTTATTSRTASSLPIFISLAIHIPAVIAWLGIVVFDALVVTMPFLTPAQRGSLLARPRWVAVALIPIIFGTGIFQTIYNPFSTVTDFTSLEALRTTTTYGQALFFKHGFVLLSLVLTLGVGFKAAPQLLAFADDTEATDPPRVAGVLAWANVLACIALLLCVAVMVYQLH
jgi:uncharacterized cupredoxin-like copper-binding protein